NEAAGEIGRNVFAMVLSDFPGRCSRTSPAPQHHLGVAEDRPGLNGQACGAQKGQSFGGRLFLTPSPVCPSGKMNSME
ncbi:hypothetical protein ACTGZM_11090, partial [Streptococcus suis]